MYYLRARVIDTSKMPTDEAHLLSTVKIKNLKTNKTVEYLMVSPEEADFQEGKISVTSPVGSFDWCKIGTKSTSKSSCRF